MEVNMSSRQNQILELETFLTYVDTEVTMILQSLQWDRKHLTEKTSMVACQYNSHHRVPPDRLLDHEKKCFLKSQGYTENDRLLPSPVDPDAATLVKFDSEKIGEIINKASNSELSFKRVLLPLDVTDNVFSGCSGIQPLTLERLQVTYTSDERRVIHDAVVNQVPSCHDLSDLALLSAKDDESKEIKPKSKLEILAELRDMKRRRTKYRVASKSRNYSDVLRDVINTQMELYNQAQDTVKNEIKKELLLDSNERNGNISKDDSISILKNSEGPVQNKESDNRHSSKKERGDYKEAHHPRYHEKYESRKRSYKCEKVTPSKYMKTERCEKLDTHKSYKCNTDDRATDSTKHAYSRSNIRDNRDVEAPSRERQKYHNYDSEKYKRNNEKYSTSRKKSHTEHSRIEKHSCDLKDAADIRKYRDKEKCYSYSEHSLDAQRRRHKDRHEISNEHDDTHVREDKETSTKHEKHSHHKHRHHSHAQEKDNFEKKHTVNTSDREDGQLSEHFSSKNKDYINLKSKHDRKNQPYDTYKNERQKRRKDDEIKRDSLKQTKVMNKKTFYSDVQGRSEVLKDEYHNSDKSHSRVHRRRSSENADHKFSERRKYDSGYSRHKK